MKQKLPSQLTSRLWLVLCFACCTAFSAVLIHPYSTFAQVELLKDINGEPAYGYNTKRWLTDGGSRMYFVHDNQLWKSNGTTSSTEMIKRFESISDLVMAGGTLYFIASSAETGGAEIWKSNGTTSGTVMVKDIAPGSDGSSPAELTNVNGKLFFVANNKVNGRELWTTNGTSTIMVKDILRVSGSSNPSSLTSLNGMVYFSANDGVAGYELWRSDGTATGTTMVKDIRAGSKVSSSPQWIRNINSTLFFAATDAEHGSELWKSDGTSEGTVFVKDIFAGASSSGIENLVDVNGQLFFTANDGIHGDELWKSDGSTDGTMLVEDLNPGKNGSNTTDPFLMPMHSFKNINGILLFVASVGSTDYIYRSDGTIAGTYRLSEARGVGMNEPNPAFTYYNGYVYYFNGNYVNGVNHYWLWRMEYPIGPSSTMKEFAENPSYYDDYTQEMISYKGFLYTTGRFASVDGSGPGMFRFIRSNGTAGGTIYLKELPGETIGSDPSQMVRVNDLVYITTNPDMAYPKRELYRTDGTPAGTFKLLDLKEDTEMIKCGDKLFVSTSTYGMGGELYVTSGSPESTFRLRSGGPTTVAEKLLDVNGVLYFTDSNATLWKTDGTNSGKFVADFQAILSIANHNGEVYVITQNVFSNQLVILHRIAADGLRTVKIIRYNVDDAPVYTPTASVGNGFYFVQSDGVHGNEIWRSDGTEGGTFMMFDLNTADENYTSRDYDIRSFLVFNDRLHFSAKDSNGVWGWYAASGFHSYSRIADMPEVDQSVVNNGMMYLFGRSGEYQHYYQYSIYTSRGHANNTKFLHNVEGYGGRLDHAVIGNHVYFASTLGNSIMRTDGTTCGTMEIPSGTQYAFPMESIGNHLVFASMTAKTGKEPYVFYNIGDVPNPAECESAQFATLTSEEPEPLITPYPNPFVSEFSIRVNGKENEVAEVAVFTSFGKPVEVLRGLKANTDHLHVGQSWDKGIYLIRVNRNGVVKNYTVVKD